MIPWHTTNMFLTTMSNSCDSFKYIHQQTNSPLQVSWKHGYVILCLLVVPYIFGLISLRFYYTIGCWCLGVYYCEHIMKLSTFMYCLAQFATFLHLKLQSLKIGELRNLSYVDLWRSYHKSWMCIELLPYQSQCFLFDYLKFLYIIWISKLNTKSSWLCLISVTPFLSKYPSFCNLSLSEVVTWIFSSYFSSVSEFLHLLYQVWVIHRESSWITSFIWIIFLICFGR